MKNHKICFSCATSSSLQFAFVHRNNASRLAPARVEHPWISQAEHDYTMAANVKIQHRFKEPRRRRKRPHGATKVAPGPPTHRNGSLRGVRTWHFHCGFAVFLASLHFLWTCMLVCMLTCMSRSLQPAFFENVPLVRARSVFLTLPRGLVGAGRKAIWGRMGSSNTPPWSTGVTQALCSGC